MCSRKQYLISLLSHRKDFTVSWWVPVSASGQSCVSPSPLPHLPSLSFAEFSFPVLSRAVTATPGALPRSAIYFELPFHCHKEGRGYGRGAYESGCSQLHVFISLLSSHSCFLYLLALSWELLLASLRTALAFCLGPQLTLLGLPGIPHVFSPAIFLVSRHPIKYLICWWHHFWVQNSLITTVFCQCMRPLVGERTDTCAQMPCFFGFCFCGVLSPWSSLSAYFQISSVCWTNS